MNPITFALLVKPAATCLFFVALGVAIFLALWAAGRRDARAGVKTRAVGVSVAAVSCLAMGGLFAFIFAFYAITG
jgi:hypothetical protein